MDTLGNQDTSLTITKVSDDKWANFIRSLDVDPEKARGIEQLPDDQKLQLLEHNEIRQYHHSPIYCTQLIRTLPTEHFTKYKKSRKGQSDQAVDIFHITEISLRTNDVGWVYQFLDQDGHNVLIKYIFRALPILLKVGHRPPEDILNGDNSTGLNTTLSADNLFVPEVKVAKDIFGVLCSGFRKKSDFNGNHGSFNHTHKLPHSLRIGLHQTMKCFRALFNNQRGCVMTFQHPQAVNMITLCLLHPDLTTKILVLELLTALCLIEGGHERVIRAFDTFKLRTGENKRFQYLVRYLTDVMKEQSESHADDFALSCVQFINILVHSTDNITLRVCLQEEFKHLGYSDVLHRLQNDANEPTLLQIDAYRDNEVDVAVLLEDSQFREILQQEKDQLQLQIVELQTRLATMENEHALQISMLKDDLEQMELHRKELEFQQTSQSNELSTLRTQLKDKDTIISEREHQLQDCVSEMEKLIQQSTFSDDRQRSSGPMGDAERKSQKMECLTAESASLPPPSLVSTTRPCPMPTPPSPPSSLPSFPPPPPPPPPPTQMGYSQMQPRPPPGSAVTVKSSVPTRVPVQPRHKLPILNWTPVPTQQLTGTIFVRMNDEAMLAKLDTEGFENEFKLSSQPLNITNVSNGLDNKDIVVSKKPGKRSLVDPSRHRCIGVVLHYLESEKYTPDHLWLDIANMSLTQDVADRIYSQVPTSSEVKLYLDYEYSARSPVAELTEEDCFLLRLCKVERLIPRLETMLFMNSFDDNMNHLLPKINAVRSASTSLMKSELFRLVLQLILAFGNYLNGSRRGVVYGFRLKSLNTLLELRTSDRSRTLLHYLVDTVDERYPALAKFYEELASIDDAAKVPTEALTCDVTALIAGMDQADKETSIMGPKKTPARLSDFIEKNKLKVEYVKKEAEVAISAFTEAIEWFGEGTSKTSPEIFFSYVAKFVESFKKAARDNEVRRRTETLLSSNLITTGRNFVTTNNNNNSELVLPQTSLNNLPRRPKDNIDAKDMQKHLAQEAKLAKRRLNNRTRQIVGDGMMDEILSSLVSTPLQVEVHSKRVRSTNCD